MSGSAFRVHRSGYVHLPNAAVNDEQCLSYLALGLLAYMLARPDGWAFHRDRLCRGPELSNLDPLTGRRRRPAREGREAVARGLRELAAAGYYRTVRVQAARGRFATVTEVTDTPFLWPSDGPT